MKRIVGGFVLYLIFFMMVMGLSDIASQVRVVGPGGSSTPAPIGPVLLPQVPSFDPSGSSQAFYAAAAPVGFPFTVPKDGVLDGVEGWASQDVAMSDFWVSFEDINPANGYPDGTKDQWKLFTSANLTNFPGGWTSFTGLTSDGTPSGTKRTVTKGQRLYVTLRYATGTTNGQLSFRKSSGSNTKSTTFGGGLIFALQNTTKWLSSGIYLALKYDDGTYGNVMGWYPYVSIANVSISSSAPRLQRGIAFTLDKPAIIRGFWFGTIAQSTGGYQIKLIDSTNTTLATGTFVPLHAQGVNLGSTDYNVVIDEFPTSTTVKAGTYRLVIECSTGGCDIWELTFPTVAVHDAMPGGSLWYATQRTTNVTTWTDTTTKRPVMGPVVSAF